MHTFLACPIVWNSPNEKAIAVFRERHRPRAEAILENLPFSPPGGWSLLPMIGVELLAWLREQHARGVRWLVLDPGFSDGTMTSIKGLKVDLAKLLASGKTLLLFEEMGGLPPE
jgi:hypothetical protein